MPWTRVLNELLTFVRTVDSNAQAQEALSDHQASKEAKKKLAVALGGPATTAEVCFCSNELALILVAFTPRGLPTSSQKSSSSDRTVTLRALPAQSTCRRHS